MRPDRALYPESGFTKSDAMRYYRGAAKWLLPHLRDVPISFKRYPDTVDGISFWEKDAPSFTPKWVKTFSVPRRSGEPEIRYVVVNDVRTLLWIVDVGGIEIHPFLHRAPHIARATSVVFDLDPGSGADIRDCCRVALLLRDVLTTVGLQSLAKVSGSKGLQVYVPLNAGAAHQATEPFARLTADVLAEAYPKRVVSRMPKELRARKVFVDWSQNADYKTTVSVYSLRAKSATPYVSLPVTWEEVERAEDLYFDPDAALRRMARMGDLFAPLLTMKQALPVTPVLTARSVPRAKRSDDEPGAIVNGIRLPRPKSQSSRRLFLIAKTEQGEELWMEMLGRFQRWILGPDRIALPAGDLAVEKEWYRGEVPPRWRGRVSIEEAGPYELIEGSLARGRLDLWFTGRRLDGEWVLRLTNGSWELRPQLARVQ